VQLGLKALRSQGYEPTIRGMLWQQGESDAKKEETAGDYGKNLARFIARVRGQFQTPDMPFVYGYVLPPPNAGHYRELVRQGEKEVDQNSGTVSAVKGAFVVATDDLSQRADDRNTRHPKDHVHFGTAGAMELGRRMAEKMAGQAGRAP
jgi:lysophospholipase L1-like esterase